MSSVKDFSSEESFVFEEMKNSKFNLYLRTSLATHAIFPACQNYLISLYLNQMHEYFVV